MLLRSWPLAVLHVDGDAFFASCEQAVNPALRGKPVVTGKERNIVAAASDEAKAYGVSRGVALWEARKLCPDLVVLPSDYETYSLFSQRMFTILRRYTPDVEEYSIDEAFADLTGLRRLHRAPYAAIARRIQEDIHRDLGITVSVGLSITKTLAKIASKHRKPAGFTAVSGREITTFLRDLPVENVWNIGPNTAALLRKYGMTTALAFAGRSELFLKTILTKPGLTVWQELNGRSILPIVPGVKTPTQSISKVKTFTPPTSDREYVFAQLTKNVENACIKARRYRLAPRRLVVFLRRQDFKSAGAEGRLSRPTAFPLDLVPIVRELFRRVYQPTTLYRQAGVVLAELIPALSVQPTLFDHPLRIEKIATLYQAVDALREKYGKHIVHQGASLPVHRAPHRTARDEAPQRKTSLLKGETRRRRLPLPLMRITI